MKKCTALFGALPNCPRGFLGHLGWSSGDALCTTTLMAKAESWGGSLTEQTPKQVPTRDRDPVRRVRLPRVVGACRHDDRDDDEGDDDDDDDDDGRRRSFSFFWGGWWVAKSSPLTL